MLARPSTLVLALVLGLIPTTALAQAEDDGWTETEEEEQVEAEEPVEDPPLPATREPDPPPPARPAPAATPAPAQPPPMAAGSSGAPATPQQPVVVRTTHSRGWDAEEEEEEEEDETDHYDFLIIELFGGVSYVDLRAVSHENYYPEFIRLEGTGPMGGAALGFRIEFFALGVRGSVAHYADEFDLGTVAAEATLMLPIPVVKPYLRVGFGLAWHGDGDFMAPTTSQTTVFGFVFNAALGLDIYLADWFALGAAFSVDILNMNRQSTDDAIPDPRGAGDVMFTETGDAVGIQARGQGSASFHF